MYFNIYKDGKVSEHNTIEEARAECIDPHGHGRCTITKRTKVVGLGKRFTFTNLEIWHEGRKVG